MSTLRRYVLYTFMFAAVATACSTTDQNPPGQAGAAGSSVTAQTRAARMAGFTAGFTTTPVSLLIGQSAIIQMRIVIVINKVTFCDAVRDANRPFSQGLRRLPGLRAS